jgi:predicted glycogen debranching enzyme
MPSDFPWDGSAPKYLASDVSLWFVNAVWQYLRYGGDAAFVERYLMPAIDSILANYRQGTELGIRVDAEGLVVAHEPGVPTTWMDAQAGDWVMTPRYGRAVEVNALWYNALRIAGELVKRFGDERRADALAAEAERTRASFNRRFWNEAAGCCVDVVDDATADPAIRPNQLFALSLPFSVLSPDRREKALDTVGRELLTEFGLRTLSPKHPHYTPKYCGGVEQRDRAYHQGTVFPWLLGPYVTAMLRVRGRSRTVRDEAGKLLDGCMNYLRETGQVCELFDGDPPQEPGGLRASARSVGELLRCYVEDVLDLAPVGTAPVEPTVGGPEVEVRPVKVGRGG